MLMETVKIKSLGIKAEKIEGVLGKIMGLMFSGKRSLLFVFRKEQKAGIHMLFVFFPIIVVWLNEKKKITRCSVARPFISFPSGKGKYVLEVPYDREIFEKLKNKSKLMF